MEEMKYAKVERSIRLFVFLEANSGETLFICLTKISNYFFSSNRILFYLRFSVTFNEFRGF